MENQPETPLQTPPAPVNETAPITSSPQSKLPLILLVILLLFLFSTGGMFLGKYLSVSQNNLPIPTLAPKPTVVPTVTPDVTSNWKTYANTKLGFSFRYPDNLTFSRETSTSVTLNYINDNNRNSITINFSRDFKNFTNYQSLKLCSTYKVAVDQFPPLCITDGKGWNQTEDVADIKLGNISAKSFYTTFGPDSDTHIVQTTVDPKFEISMNVAGGGLDGIFSQILSTFKFLD